MHTEAVRRISHFTAQANANLAPEALAADPFTDAAMLKQNGLTGSESFYIGCEDASVIGIVFGTAYTDNALSQAAELAEDGKHLEQWIAEEDPRGVDLWSLRLADTGERVWAVVVGDSDHCRDSVTFYGCADDAYAAFEDATDADNFGGRA
jgi:hypothetical protein